MANDNGGFSLGFLVGGVIGVAVGILIAPKSGSETRAELAERLRHGGAGPRNCRRSFGIESDLR